jgi:3-(3-hydroxy-phenyl)propionate hydroxylase
MSGGHTSAVYDVAIVGFGPSGAVAANLLGQYGLTVFVCDRQREVYDKPRAIALDHEIMRVFQQIGVADAVSAWAAPFTPSEYYGVDGDLIKRFTMVDPPYPLAHPPSLVFTQPPVEAILREAARGRKTVEVALGCELIDLHQEPDREDGPVTLELTGDDGTAHRVRARYVIACDGASSTARRLVGIELEDLIFDEPWLVVDVLVNEQGLAKLPSVSVQYCQPQRPCTYVIGPKNHRRWEISLLPGEDPREMATEAATWGLLSRWLTPEDGQLWRQASYRFHALVARDWRSGRVFVAGDAAHQQPPFLGQGMCQGVRDVANLAWKLRAVLAGQADDRLLDSYGAERSHHVRRLTGRLKEIGALICERDVAKARERDARLIAAGGGTIRSEPRQNVQPALEGGLISPDAHPANGTLFPQPWIVGGPEPVRMDELCGSGWRIVFDALALPSPELPAAAIERLAPRVVGLVAGCDAGPPQDALQEADGVVAGWFRRHGCAAAILRPDHYVYGVAATADDLLRQVNGLLARIDG